MDRYASRLALHLRSIATDLEILLACQIAPLTLDPDGIPRAHRASGPLPVPILPVEGAQELRRYYDRYYRYPRRVRGIPADVLHVLDHSYAHILESRRHRRRIVTVHDLFPVLTVQSGARSWKERLRNHLLGRVLAALRRADAWIVATEWMRQELAQWLGRDDPRLHVIPYGVDDAFFEPAFESRSATRARWRVPEKAFVLLHVGSVGPRKNLPTVIAATDALRRAGLDAWLVQLGGTLTPEQAADIEARGLQTHVRALGEANEAELRAGYRASDVLLFPSHYEGFGFPVLEAMASELPVVTSGAGGLAEVAGDAALVVGGREVGPYVTAVRRVATNAQWRQQLVTRGLVRARQFRWIETARRTAEVYRALS